MEDKDIQFKQELVKKAKELASNLETEENVYKKASELARSWKSSFDDVSLLEQELQDKFDTYINQIYAKLNENRENNEIVKKEIISSAKELLKNTNYKESSPKMKELFDKWKLSGPVAKEKQEELWNEFDAIRNEFYTKRQEFFDNIEKNRQNALEIKKNLIDEAVEANKIEDIKELTIKMAELFDKWKAAGSSGKENDDELWKAFLAQRQIFFDKKNSYFEQMKQVYESRAEQKKEIIQKAKICLANSLFTKEEIQTMDDLRNKWKEIGSAGKEFENDLWTQFSSILNKYRSNRQEYEKAIRNF